MPCNTKGWLAVKPKCVCEIWLREESFVAAWKQPSLKMRASSLDIAFGLTELSKEDHAMADKNFRQLASVRSVCSPLHISPRCNLGAHFLSSG